MQEFLNKQIANGFSGFAGSVVSGSVQMSESLLNELMAEALKGAAAPQPAPVGGTAPPVAQLLKLLSSTKLRVVDRAVALDFEIRV